MFIYIITNKAWPEYVKVGRTYNVENRLKQYQTQCPLKDYEVYFYTKTDNIVELENIFINLYGKNNGEWYKIDKDIAVSLIKENLYLIEKDFLKKEKVIDYEDEIIYNCYEFNNWKFDYVRNICIDIYGNEYILNKTESNLLKLLIDNDGNILTRDNILKNINNLNSRTIDNHILKFRKLFEVDTRNPAHFYSIRGLGYKFVK